MFGRSERLKIVEKAGAWKSDSPFDKNLKILRMGSIFSRKHEMEIWYIFETLKPRNQATSKPRSFETKKLFDFQVRESPAPLNGPTPTAAPDNPMILRFGTAREGKMTERKRNQNKSMNC